MHQFEAALAALANAADLIVRQRGMSAVDVTDEKLEFARRHGATDVVNAQSEDAVQAVRRLTGGGADYTFEVLGSAPTIRQALETPARRAHRPAPIDNKLRRAAGTAARSTHACEYAVQASR